jgi:hypothetical protein
LVEFDVWQVFGHCRFCFHHWSLPLKNKESDLCSIGDTVHPRR